MTKRATVSVERLGQRGEGIAQQGNKPLYIPYALAGETVIADIDGERGHLVEILAPSPDRIEPFCQYYGVCGGCAVQTLAAPAYADWKRGLVVSALKYANVSTEVGPLIDAHGDGRRRATFHARFDKDGTSHVGFMKVRAHELIELDACPILAPAMQGALPAAQAIAEALKSAASHSTSSSPRLCPGSTLTSKAMDR